MTMLPVLGIVGGIGSGKSYVAKQFERHGGHLIDADRLGHEALRDPATRDEVVTQFGEGILGPGGEIDRGRLGQLVFSDKAQLQRLEAIVFPWIGRRIREEIDLANRQGQAAFVILDAAIMQESGWAIVCDLVLFVDAPRDVRLARLRQQRGWSDSELARREASQWPLEKKKQHAQRILANTGSEAELQAEVRATLAALGVAVEPGRAP